jgi:DNA-binding phage protein
MRTAQKLKPFDITCHLDSDAIAEYLSQVLQDDDSDDLIRSLSHIAEAKGVADPLLKLLNLKSPI